VRLFSLAVVVLAVLTGAAASSTPGLQRAADRLVATSDIPGVITLLEQDGRRTLVAAGEADIAKHQKIRTGDRFWIGSVTKTFLAVVVMQLVDEGRISLDDTVEQLLPGRMREGRKVRLRHLLSHTSGIPEYMNIEPFVSAVRANPRVVIPARRLVTAATRLPLEFIPGSQASYSNTNYLVVGELLERLTRRPIARLLRERIFDPLNLRSTAFESGRGAVGGRNIHGYDVTGVRPRDVSRHRLAGPWADGALVSSVRDLAVFMGALLRGKIVPPRLAAQMRTVLDVPGSHGQGLGLFELRSPCGRPYYGNTGGTPGYATFVAGSRDARRIVVISVNGISPDALQAMGLYLDKLLCPR
jgi:D-alanyl-D-alanine carboxypeptidase